MSYPKIVYNSITLNFTYPPRNVPYYSKETVRHDNIASSGKAEHIFERSDSFMKIGMTVIPDSDAAAWAAFLDWAEQGKEFDYYPDASSSSHSTCTLEDTASELAWKAPGVWAGGTLKFRVVV